MPLTRLTLLCLLLSCCRVVGGETAQAVATITAGFVTAIRLISGGSGYASEPLVTITGGGGSGATAKAILKDDRVATVVVLTAGSGYTSAPKVTIADPPRVPTLTLELIPKLTVLGEPGTVARVEWSDHVSGPWMSWSNLVVNPDGVVLIDLSPGAVRRFYRAVLDPRPLGPPGYVWIPPGTFLMGSPEGEKGHGANEIQHSVTLTLGFWMSDHETTQGEYQAVIGSNPSVHKGDPDLPVDWVSWDDAVFYCQKLTDSDRAAGKITPKQAYRLPTEAEWEWAARAGTTASRPGELNDIAWWSGNSDSMTHEVRQKSANAWGLYDMLGNVYEWCSDYYGDYPGAAVTDPTGPDSGMLHILRGGAYFSDSGDVRSAFRGGGPHDLRFGTVGFRPVLSAIH